MRRDADFFEDREMDLIYIAKKLEGSFTPGVGLTESGVDYAVESDRYSGGVIFRSERVGAFFYVLPEARSGAPDNAGAWLSISGRGKRWMSKHTLVFAAGAALAVSLFAQNAGTLTEQYRDSAVQTY